MPIKIKYFESGSSHIPKQQQKTPEKKRKYGENTLVCYGRPSRCMENVWENG